METKKMGLLAMVLLVVVSGGIFMEVKNVEACVCWVGARCIAGCDIDRAAGSTCSDTGVSGHACTVYHSLLDHAVCLIDPWAGARTCVVGDACTKLNSWKYCSEDKCRTAVGGANVEDPTTNGKVCRVTTADSDLGGGYGKCGDYLEGVWDNSQKQCVECGGGGLNRKEVGVYGNAANTYVIGPSPYAMNAAGMASANNNFEHACGADESCDEKIVTEACTGGNCDLNGECCTLPDVLDAGNNCVPPAVKGIYLTITPAKSTIGEFPETTNVTFSVKDESGNNVAGIDIVINWIACDGGMITPGFLSAPAPPFVTGAGGIATSLFTAPTLPAFGLPSTRCDIDATATDPADITLTSNAVGSINILGGNCVFASGTPKISFGSSSYAIGDTIEVTGGSNDEWGCTALYYPSVTEKDSGNFVALWNYTASAGAGAGETGTWYGGLFLSGGCGAYADADCQVQVEVTASAAGPPPGPPCIPDWGAWTACVDAPGSQSQTDAKCGGSRSQNCCDIDFGNVSPLNHCALPFPICDAPANHCVECLTTPDCSWKGPDYVCDSKVCVPCKGEGEAATASHLCCYGLNWLNGICTSACDPNSWFFCNPLRTNVEALAEGGERIIGYILGLIGSVALLLIIISGAMYMTSAGNEERIASSKKILTAAVIGLGIALLAYSLLLVIMTVLGM